MPTGKVHIDQALTNVSLAKKNATGIARKVLIECPVDKQTDRLYKYGDEIYLAEDDARAPGSEANDTDFRVTDVGYACTGHARRHKIPRDKANNADPALNLMIDTTRTLTEKSQLTEELNCVSALAAAMTGDSYLDCTGLPWTSPDVNPLLLLKQKIDTVNLLGGMPPNVLALSGPVMTAIRTNKNSVGLVTGAQAMPAARITAEQIAEYLELDEVVVGRMVYKPTPTSAKQFVWGEKALLFYRPSAPGLLTNALGYTMTWMKALASVTGLENVPGMEGVGPQFVQTYFWEPEISDYVVTHNYYGQTIYSAECGLLMDNCLTA